MDNENRGKTVAIICQGIALAVIMASLLLELRVLFPLQHAANESRMSYSQLREMKRDIADRYNILSEMDGLSEEQQQRLKRIKEEVGF